MSLKIMNIDFTNKLKFSDIKDGELGQFIVTSIDSGRKKVLRGKKPVEVNKMRFRVNAVFERDLLKRISLIIVTKQDNDKYKNIDDIKKLQEIWLVDSYGNPDKRETYGLKYDKKDYKICSEYDPRSGTAEIFYIFN